MQIRMLRNPSKSLSARLDCRLREGEAGRVKNEIGEELIKLRIAEPIDADDKKDIKGVSKKPEVNQAGPPEIKK